MAERSLVIRLIGDDRSLHQTFTKSTRESKAFAANLQRTAKSTNAFAASTAGAVRATGGFSRGFLSGAGALSSFGGALALTSGSFFAGAGIVAGLKGAVTAAADFEQTMNVLAQVSGATAAQMALASEEARKLGADISLPATSATDAAQAMEQLAKGGLSIGQALGAARGTLQLAAAAQTDVGTAANTTARALSAFGLAGTDAGKIADALAGGAQAATGEIEDFAIALSQSGTVAHSFGLTAQDTVAAITELAKAGLVGSDAGTSLRVMLGRLRPQAVAAQKEIKKLGIAVTDGRGNFLNFRDIIANYNKALSDLSPVARQSALQTIFGTDAQRAANIIFGQGVSIYDGFHKSVTRTGQAQRAAAAQQKGFNGALDGFNSALNTTAVALGTGILPPLTIYLKHLSTWLSDTETQTQLQENFNAAFSTTKTLIEGFAGVVKDVDRVTGSFKNTIEILIALKLGLVISGWAGSLAVLRTRFLEAAAAEKALATTSAVSRIEAYTTAIAGTGGAATVATGKVGKLRAALAGLAGLNINPIVIPIAFAAIGDRLTGGKNIATDLLNTLRGKSGLSDALFGSKDSFNLFNAGARESITKLFGQEAKPPESDLRVSAAKVAKETTDFNKRVARKVEDTISKNPVVVNASKGLKITADQRNTFFDNSISRILLRGGLGDTKAEIASLQKANSLISARLKVTKDITRRLNLEDELLQNAAQIKSLNAQASAQALSDAADALSKRQSAMDEFIANLQLGLTKAQTTASFTDDIAALKALQAGIEKEIKEFGLTADLAGQLFDVQQNLKNTRKQARTASLFKQLGLTAEGDEITPGVKNLRKRLGQLTANIEGTKLDTPKLRSQLARFRKVLANNLLPKDIRAKVKQMMDDIASQLKQSGSRNQTKFRHASSDAVLAGLGLTPDQIRTLKSRISQIGAGGTVPGSRSAAFSGAGAQFTVFTTVNLDGQKVAQSTTNHQRKADKRRTTSRRGYYAGRH